VSGGTAQPAGPDDVLRLIHELLDAHADTVELATPPGTSWSEAAGWPQSFRRLRWDAHLDYLRALQRRGREILAHSDLFAPASSARTSSR
jgi:hypothetical protein